MHYEDTLIYSLQELIKFHLNLNIHASNGGKNMETIERYYQLLMICGSMMESFESVLGVVLRDSRTLIDLQSQISSISQISPISQLLLFSCGGVGKESTCDEKNNDDGPDKENENANYLEFMTIDRQKWVQVVQKERKERTDNSTKKKKHNKDWHLCSLCFDSINNKVPQSRNNNNSNKNKNRDMNINTGLKSDSKELSTNKTKKNKGKGKNGKGKGKSKSKMKAKDDKNFHDKSKCTSNGESIAKKNEESNNFSLIAMNDGNELLVKLGLWRAMLYWHYSQFKFMNTLSTTKPSEHVMSIGNGNKNGNNKNKNKNKNVEYYGRY